MATAQEIVAQVVSRRPFAVLGYSAEDAVWCPACLRSAAGLSPGQVDSAGRTVIPLYARDHAVREEVCDNCERPLIDLLASGRRVSTPTPVTAHLRVYGQRSALDFDRVPPLEVRSSLKSSGWRWDPRFRLWWSSEAVPSIPPNVVFPVDSPRTAQPIAPIVRRRSAKTP